MRAHKIARDGYRVREAREPTESAPPGCERDSRKVREEI